jgi:hypothetical protein
LDKRQMGLRRLGAKKFADSPLGEGGFEPSVPLLQAAVPTPLVELAELVLEGACSFQRAVEAAPRVHRGGGREPVQNSLEAADRIVTVEHQTDMRERDVTVALMVSPVDCRRMYLVGAIAGHLEEAAGALLRASLTLRDHILGEVMFD